MSALAVDAPGRRVVAIVAAKDAAATVGPTVAALVGAGVAEEVVVVDDGSADTTADAALAAGAVVVRLPENVGKGGALAAGVQATPDADVYLLVDADVGSTAARAARLLPPVLGGEADMVVGVLPGAGRRGGFGLVRELAGRGIRRATRGAAPGGFDVRAPLSGQRAVRASLLRAIDLAPRFGLETALTIDAVRAGGRVLEVPVEMEHAHTGRGPRGFAHRARQGADIGRALWPRLTSPRARVATIAAALIVALVAALWSGGRWEPSSTPPELGQAGGAIAPPGGTGSPGTAAKVLIIGVPGLGFDDLRGGSVPEIAALARHGALAAMSVRTLSHGPSPAEGYATLGAGSRVRAVEASARAEDGPGGGVTVSGAATTLAANAGRHLPTFPGALGTALHAAGRRTAVVGSADGGAPNRPAAVALMDRSGMVDGGDVEGLAVPDPAAPGGRRADLDQVAARARAALASADVVLVDPGDLERASRPGPARARALAASDDLVGRLTSDLPPDTLALVTSVVPPGTEWRLTPLVATGAGVVHGYLHSPSTKRLGLVVLTDLAPTVLATVGAPIPDAMIGHPLRYHAVRPDTASPDVGRLAGLDRDSAYRERIYFRAALWFIVFQAVFYALAILALGRRRQDQAPPAGWWPAALRAGALGVAAFPLATFVLRAVPGAARLGGPGGGAVLALIDAVVVALALQARRSPLSPLAWVLGATAWLLVADVATGARLQVASILGYSPHTAGRFFGIGNTAFAVLAATSILGAALHVHHAPRRREALVAVAAFFALVAVVDGAPSLGDDVGGILTLVPVFGLVLVALARRRPSWRTVTAVVGATAATLAVATAADLLRPPEARTHLGRVVADTWNHGPSSLLTTAGRKADVNLQILRSSIWTWAVPVIALFLLYLLVWRRQGGHLLPSGSPLRTGVVGALAAGLLGFALNDSGVVITALVLTYVGPFLTFLAVARARPGPILVEPPTGRPRSLARLRTVP